jgi:hypothetical protein
MNFLDFINQQQYNEPNNTNTKCDSKSPKLNKKSYVKSNIQSHTTKSDTHSDTTSDIQFDKANSSNTKECFNDNGNLNDIYQHIKSGDNIRMIHRPNSILNCYKGYIGEIKEYKKGQSYALIFLYAINTYNLIKVPIEHFIKIKL